MNLKKLYKDGWQLIKNSKIYLLIISALFIVSIIIGFLFPVFFADFIEKFIQDTLAKTSGMGFWQLLLFILENNVATSLVGLLLGIIFGIIPLFLVFFNGYVLGFVANKSAAVAGASILWRLVPHGIFEIPALILSLALGLRLGFFFTRKKKIIKELASILKTFFIFVVPLLIVAAVIETSLIILLG